MSLDRRTTNPGKRERQARKRRRRALIWDSRWGAEAAPLKVGHVHSLRWARRSLAVVDSRKSEGKRALESARRSSPSPPFNVMNYRR